MKRKRKQPKTQFKVTVAWFMMKRVFSTVGLYPKRYPSSRIEFLLWCHEYTQRVKKKRRKYELPEYEASSIDIVFKGQFIGTGK